jgi:hypothetical protein
VRAIPAQDDDTYLGAENAYNLFAVRRNAETATDEERARLEVVGEYHLGPLSSLTLSLSHTRFQRCSFSPTKC